MSIYATNQSYPYQCYTRSIIKMDHFERNFWDLPDVAASQCPGGVFLERHHGPLTRSALADLENHEKERFSPSPAPAPPSVSQEFKSALGPITVTFLAPQVTSSPTSPSPSARRRKNAHCHLCDKRFENRYKLKMHLNTHTGARPFTCDVCGKGFMRRTTLNGHRSIHDASQFSCPTCNRTFKRSSERLIHILLKVCLRRQRILRRTAAGWFCDVCDKSVPLPQEHKCPVKGRRRQCPVCGIDFGGQRDHKMLTHVRHDHPEFLVSL
ncbi:zinc finger protein 628-like [Penaeus monodon]|uniref:zinc finger protein 628-like n=1 Tax=Penaeus monodon TaxID=6687 RepID=UPI0018A7D48A|nr:zinc finger protein 628-like [Penaeus monodon]